MFNHIRETIHILTYRDNRDLAQIPDVEFRSDAALPATPSGKRIARLFEVLIAVVGVAFCGERLASLLSGAVLHHGQREAALPVLTGIVSGLMLWALNSIFGNLGALMHKRLNLRTHLAPYFGHRLDATIRTLRS